jgi:hypothetical protein
MNEEELTLIAARHDALEIMDILDIDEYALLKAFDYLVEENKHKFLDEVWDDR